MYLLRNLVYLFAVIIGLSACGPKIIYQDDRVMESGTWSYQDSITFSFKNDDLNSYYDILLDLNHSSDYAWENVYLKINTTFPDSVKTQQILPIEFSDLTGTWLGDCNDSACDLEVELALRSRFQQAGAYAITIIQESRQNNLSGINSIGLRIAESSK